MKIKTLPPMQATSSTPLPLLKSPNLPSSLLSQDVNTWSHHNDSPEMAEHSKYRATASEAGNDEGEMLTVKTVGPLKMSEGVSCRWAKVKQDDSCHQSGSPHMQCTSLQTHPPSLACGTSIRHSRAKPCLM